MTERDWIYQEIGIALEIIKGTIERGDYISAAYVANTAHDIIEHVKRNNQPVK